MRTWSSEEEEELSILIKDWLKQQNRTQADLGCSLQAASSRMHALLEVLEKEYQAGGIIKVAARLCKIEAEWAEEEKSNLGEDVQNTKTETPFNQLDFLLQAIRDDCGES